MVQDLPGNAVQRTGKRPRGGASRGTELERLRWGAIIDEPADIQLLERCEDVFRDPIPARLVPWEAVPIQEAHVGCWECSANRKGSCSPSRPRTHDHNLRRVHSLTMPWRGCRHTTVDVMASRPFEANMASRA